MGLPWNVSRNHRPFPLITEPAEYRMCQRCGSRNQFVNKGTYDPEAQNLCQPSCAAARAQRGRTVDLRGEEAK